jgi:hypothetical protein
MPERLAGVVAVVTEAAQRRHAALGGVTANLAHEGDLVQPGDLALALAAGRVILGQPANQRAKWGVEAPISWRTSSTVGSWPAAARSGCSA